MSQTKNSTVLIVDDDDVLREVMVYDFKNKGYHVLEAENGTKAFDVINSNKVDVVITDIRMPGGDGIDLLKNIKSSNTTSPVVIMMTGYAELTLEGAYDLGADLVFAKPFDRQILFNAVAKAITNKDELWGARKHERTAVQFKIDIEFPDLQITTTGEVLNISLGGVFVKLDQQLPSLNSKAKFKMTIENYVPKYILNTGIVRWVRQNASPGRPSGCGIEFEFKDDSSRRRLIELINAIRTHAYIPKISS